MTVLCLGILSLIPSAAQAATVKVLVGSQQGKFAFEPSTVTVQPGDTVKWVNNLTADSVCNVVFDKAKFAAFPDADTAPQVLVQELDQELFDSLSHKQLLETKETVESIFNVPEGEYTYTCLPHQSEGMVGKVIVKISPTA